MRIRSRHARVVASNDIRLYRCFSTAHSPTQSRVGNGGPCSGADLARSLCALICVGGTSMFSRTIRQRRVAKALSGWSRGRPALESTLLLHDCAYLWACAREYLTPRWLYFFVSAGSPSVTLSLISFAFIASLRPLVWVGYSFKGWLACSVCVPRLFAASPCRLRVATRFM